MRYGIGYKGSKSRIAKDIIDLLPKGDRFIDLFGGISTALTIIDRKSFFCYPISQTSKIISICIIVDRKITIFLFDNIKILRYVV